MRVVTFEHRGSRSFGFLDQDRVVDVTGERLVRPDALLLMHRLDPARVATPGQVVQVRTADVSERPA